MKGKISRVRFAEVPSPPPMEPLPGIATFHFQPAKAERYSEALSDLLCWMDGFTAAGGKYAPDSLGELRNLGCALKDLFPTGNTNGLI